MQTTLYPNAAAFLDATESTLSRNEHANNLILGVPMHRREHPEEETVNSLYLAIHHEHELVGAALMTPPRHLVIHVEEQAVGQGALDPAVILHAIAKAALAHPAPVPSIVGRVPWVNQFAQLWKQRTGRDSFLQISERLFELHKVTWPATVPGHLRQATLADADLAIAWFLAFIREANPADEDPELAERGRSAIEQGRLYLWDVPEDDGMRPVSMVGRSRALGRGCTIGPVYTPPDQRGKGYASNATAALSQRLLNLGWEYTTLFTDLSNPTSNSIYQKIGYHPVCDYAVWRVE